MEKHAELVDDIEEAVSEKVEAVMRGDKENVVK